MSNIDAYSNTLADELEKQAKVIRPLVVDGQSFVRNYVNDPTNIIVVEGAQGIRLSIEVGDYPNCTSSDSNIHGTLSGAHLNPSDPTEIINVFKAYFSRVGNGPFPSEMESHIGPDGKLTAYDNTCALSGDILRDFAGEYGATTKRPRRVGWPDLMVIKDAIEVSGANALCINSLDLLGEFGMKYGKVKIAKSYTYQGEQINYLPRNIEQTQKTPQPSYDEIEGGWTITNDITTYEQLPEKAKQFITMVESFTGIPVKYVGIGPRNEDIIVRN